MPIYRFAIHHRGAETEMLGTMGLRDDAEALAFATQIIHDVPDEDRAHCSLDITDGERTVGCISCDAERKAASVGGAIVFGEAIQDTLVSS